MGKILYNRWSVATDIDVEFTHNEHTFNVITSAEVDWQDDEIDTCKGVDFTKPVQIFMDKVKLEEETDLYNIIHDYISEMLESIIDTSITDLNNEDVAIPKHTVIAGELDEALGVTV